jgi:glycerol-3-phosphate O-acyltransferase/dihydroxyacetone phosphate acyltransferase
MGRPPVEGKAHPCTRVAVTCDARERMASPLVPLLRGLVSLYFREVEVVGDVPAAEARGRIFGANHFNGLVDPILVLMSAPCPMAPVAKSTLWKVPVLGSLLNAVGAVPVARRKDDPDKPAEANEEVFARVAGHLAGGGNILIFPEGVSHEEPHLVRLRSGAGRMLARAHGEGARGLTYQAVGLEFDARDVFRSRALVVYGPVRPVDEHVCPVDELAHAITERLAHDLSELVVEGATWDERLLVARVAELYANRAGRRSMAGLNEIGRQVEAARKALGEDEGAYRAIAGAVGDYYAALDAAGLADHDVEAAGAPPRSRKRTRATMALLLPLAVPGALLWWLPYQVPRLVAARLARGERDVVSTYKLAAGVVAFPLWAAALVAAAFLVLAWPMALLAAAVVVTSPFAALAWLDFFERPRARRGEAASRNDLAKRRAEAMTLLDRVRAGL